MARVQTGKTCSDRGKKISSPLVHKYPKPSGMSRSESIEEGADPLSLLAASSPPSPPSDTDAPPLSITLSVPPPPNYDDALNAPPATSEPDVVLEATDPLQVRRAIRTNQDQSATRKGS